MSNVLERKVLVLTKDWRASSTTSVRAALQRMSKPQQHSKHLTALNVDGGEYVPTSWEDWIQLPVLEGQQHITTPRLKIRVPTMVVSNRLSKIPLVKVSLNKRSLWDRQAGKDIYSDDPLDWDNCNVDHYVPRKLGGKTEFTNCGLTKKSTNQAKGCLSAGEAGLKLKQPLTVPQPRLLSHRLRRDPEHPEWDPFLLH